MNKYTYQNNKECEFFSQYPKAKKSKINENIFSYLDFTQHQILIPKILGKKKTPQHVYML